MSQKTIRLTIIGSSVIVAFIALYVISPDSAGLVAQIVVSVGLLYGIYLITEGRYRGFLEANNISQIRTFRRFLIECLGWAIFFIGLYLFCMGINVPIEIRGAIAAIGLAGTFLFDKAYTALFPQKK